MDWGNIVDKGGAVAALLVLLFWVTRSLNGKLDRLTGSVTENTNATKDLVRVMKRHIAPIAGGAPTEDEEL